MVGTVIAGVILAHIIELGAIGVFTIILSLFSSK
jgi:hypothetical protein